MLQDMLAERPEVTQVDCMDEGLAIYYNREFCPNYIPEEEEDVAEDPGAVSNVQRLRDILCAR